MLDDVKGSCQGVGQGVTRGNSFLEVKEAGSPWSPPTLFLGNKPRVRSIRFAAGHDAEGSQSHVHFDEKLHDSVVMVTQESDSSFLVKVCAHLPRHLPPYSLYILHGPAWLPGPVCSISSKLAAKAHLCPFLGLGFPICKVGGRW